MIKFAIIGCGHIAAKHAEAINACEGAVLRAVYDTNRINAERVASQASADIYPDLDDMLADPEIDAVCICTPSGLHADQAVKAARAGKHVVVEKPIALTLEDADAILAACRDNGVKLTVVHPNRFRPAITFLKEAIREGRFGTLSHLNVTVRWNRGQAYYDQAPWRGTREFDGGVLMNQAIHALDLML
jgi:UDP-N-acetyl-2-amino-2-deoxyglucuronate dehydrogenase